MGVDDHLELVAEREDILAALVEGPLQPSDVVDRTGSSRSTVSRAVNALEEAGLVERVDDGYVATVTGRLALDRYRSFRRESADLLAAHEALAPLDVDAPLSVDFVAGSEVAVGSDETPYEPAERLHDVIEGADRYQALLPALEDPRHVRLLYEHVVTGGDPATLVVTADLYDTLVERFPRRLDAMADEPDFELHVGSVPPFGLVLTERDETGGTDVTATVVVFADSGVHGILQADTEQAVRRARDRIAEARDAGTERTGDWHQTADGGVVRGGASAAIDPDGDLLTALEREGFVRLSKGYFLDEPVADPTTAWRTGLDIAEVHTGLSVERRVDCDGTERPLTEALEAALAGGENRIVVGPPGSGKSTTCKRVACAWYDADHGPVLYREGGHGQPVESVDELVATARAADGHTLVVVEDAVRPDASAVFDAVDRLADREDVSFLLDTRETEWADPPETITKPAAHLAAVTMPPLRADDSERLVDHVEETVGTSLGVSAERLREDLQAREQGTGELLLVLHRLALCADPLADSATRLEEDVAAVYETIADDPVALDVAVLANALNAAGVELTPAHLHAVAAGDHHDAGADHHDAGADHHDAGADHHDAVREAVDELEDSVLFGLTGDGTYRTVHETWSVSFLEHLRDAAGEERARERFGRCVTGLLSLADDADRREWVEREASRTGSGHEAGDSVVARAAAEAPDWTTEIVEQLFTLGREQPKLAPLFGDGERTSIALPEACDAATATRCRAWLGRAFLAAGDYERAERAFETLPADGALAVERLLGLSEAAREQGEYDRSRDLAQGCLDRTDDDRTSARARLALGRVAREQSEYERARETLTQARETLEAAGDRRRLAQCLDVLGVVAREQSDYERAREYHERSRDIARELGDRRGEATSLKHLGTVAYYQGDHERARERFQRSLDIARDRGDRQAEANRLNNLAVVAADRADYECAREYHERSLAIKEDIGDRQGVASSLMNLGTVAFYQHDYGAAREHYERSLAIKRDLGDRRGEAKVRMNLGKIANRQGRYERAREQFQRSIDIKRNLDDECGVARTLSSLAEVELAVGNYDDARADSERSLEIHRDHDSTREQAYCHTTLGRIAERTENYDEARERFEAARDLLTAVGDRRGVADARRGLGLVAARTGDDERAREAVRTALETYEDIGDVHGQAQCRDTLGVIAHERDDLDAARDHLTAALETFETDGTVRDERDTLEHLVEVELDAGNVERARDCCDRLRECIAETDLSPDAVVDPLEARIDAAADD